MVLCVSQIVYPFLLCDAYDLKFPDARRLDCMFASIISNNEQIMILIFINLKRMNTSELNDMGLLLCVVADIIFIMDSARIPKTYECDATKPTNAKKKKEMENENANEAMARRQNNRKMNSVRTFAGEI